MRMFLCAMIAIAMALSIGASAQTYTDEEIAAIASNAQRALDIQAVENGVQRGNRQQMPGGQQQIPGMVPRM